VLSEPAANPKERANKPAGSVREEEQIGFNIVLIRMDEGHKVHTYRIQQGATNKVV
jgi:hypothetical protein